MNGDLISRNALLKKKWDADTRCGYVQVVDVGDILKAPTVDAEPVVHGRWIYVSEESDVGYDTYRCSICNEHFVVDFDFEKPKFCPVCGARMDGGEGE